MSSLLRNIALFIVITSLAACGFKPAHGTRGSEIFSGGVKILTGKDAVGQKFQQEMEDALNPTGVPANPAYILSANVVPNAAAIGVARDGTVSRYNIILLSTYELRRASDNKLVKSGQVRHVSSYNNQINQYYSTYISEKDAIARGLVELAEQYRQRLSVTLLKEGA